MTPITFSKCFTKNQRINKLNLECLKIQFNAVKIENKHGFEVYQVNLENGLSKYLGNVYLLDGKVTHLEITCL